MNLILFDDAELNKKEDLLLDSSANRERVSAFLSRRDERAVHLLKVLRKKEGDSFDAGILEKKRGTGVIEEITAEGIVVRLTISQEPPSRTPLRLGVGFPRPIQLRRLLRDCAGLGLAAIDLICTDLGEKSYRDTKLLSGGGARAAFIEGAALARDVLLPELAVYPCLAAWLQIPPLRGGAVLFAADNVQPGGSFAGLAPIHPKGNTVVLAVGSERGWSGRERELLENAGFTRLSLGKRVLRTETACTAAAILLMEKMGLLD